MEVLFQLLIYSQLYFFVTVLLYGYEMVHDEGQVACRTQKIAEDAVQIAQASMRQVQEYYGIRCLLDTEGKIGKNWFDCH